MLKSNTEYDSGLTPTDGRQTVGEYLEDWLDTTAAQRNAARTVQGYRSIVEHHLVPSIGSVRLSKLEASHVRKMLTGIIDSGLTANTARHVYAVVTKALKDAVATGLLPRNVCDSVERPKVARYEVHPPSEVVVSDILESADSTPWGPLFRLLAYTGLRRSEAMGLRWKNVDLDRVHLSVVEAAQRLTGRGIVSEPPKSASARRGVALAPETVAMLRHHRARQAEHVLSLGGAYQDQDLVFANELGNYRDPDSASHAFSRIAKSVGCTGVQLHHLRHAHASVLIAAGVHPKVVQDRLGHASAAFTMQVYGHVASGLQGEAAEAFSMRMKSLAG